MGDLRGIGQVFVCWKENGCPAHEWSGIKPKGLGGGGRNILLSQIDLINVFIGL